MRKLKETFQKTCWKRWSRWRSKLRILSWPTILRNNWNISFHWVWCTSATDTASLSTHFKKILRQCSRRFGRRSGTNSILFSPSPLMKTFLASLLLYSQHFSSLAPDWWDGAVEQSFGKTQVKWFMWEIVPAETHSAVLPFQNFIHRPYSWVHFLE